MKKTCPTLTLLVVLAFGGLLAPASGFSQNTATNPVPRAGKWMARHEGFVQQAKRGDINLLFLGDSITDHWRDRGSNVWNEYYAPLHAANFGISADRIQHVLWRIEHGELDGIDPKVIVLMIGTNNTGKERDHKTIRNTPPEVIEGVTAIVHELRTKLPESKILLLAIFPRDKPDSPFRGQIKEINAGIAPLGDDKMVTYLDIGPKFLEPDGTLIPGAMLPDMLHPTAKGYAIWAKAMKPTLDAMMK
ncbi:MAG TPA: platelet-activating factor acetylhydrolase IB subunit [Candidatus Binatia bacterium]|nr:platelet-activating factor acetylhydrolase IB subunit [Candidatus Binatia bacterium]